MTKSKFQEILESQGIGANDVKGMTIYIKGHIAYAKTKTCDYEKDLSDPNKQYPVYKVSMKNVQLVASQQIIPDSQQNPQLEQAVFNAVMQSSMVSTDPKTGIEYLYAKKNVQSSTGKDLPPFMIMDDKTKQSYWATDLEGDLGEQDVISVWNVATYTKLGGGFNIYPNGFIVPDIEQIVYYGSGMSVPQGFSAPSGQYHTSSMQDNAGQGQFNNGFTQGNSNAGQGQFNNGFTQGNSNAGQGQFNNGFTQGNQNAGQSQFNNGFTQGNQNENNNGFDPSFEDDGSAF